MVSRCVRMQKQQQQHPRELGGFQCVERALARASLSPPTALTRLLKSTLSALRALVCRSGGKGQAAISSRGRLA